MDDKYRNILRRAWPTLTKDLEPIKLLPYLVDVLDPTDEEEIKASSNEKRVSGVDKLLEILPRKGQKAFDMFKKALQKVQPHLACHLGERFDIIISCHMALIRFIKITARYIKRMHEYTLQSKMANN